jgi:hypothetical protein
MKTVDKLVADLRMLRCVLRRRDLSLATKELVATAADTFNDNNRRSEKEGESRTEYVV